jgi:hypothetical protein
MTLPVPVCDTSPFAFWLPPKFDGLTDLVNQGRPGESESA